MATMAADTGKSWRSRRQFSEEFRAQAVRLVLEEGKSVGAVARELDLTASALRQWVERSRADRSKGKTGLTTAERSTHNARHADNRQRRSVLRLDRRGNKVIKQSVTGKQ